MRRTLTALLVVTGAALMIVSFFFLSAPWGASGVADSNPRFDYAPTLFVLGVVMAFGAALVYELLPDRPKQ